MLDLIENGILLPDVELQRPAGSSQKSVSRDPKLEVESQAQGWQHHRVGGFAAALLESRSGTLFTGRDEQTDYILGEWEKCLDALEKDPYLSWPTSWTGSPSAR